MLKNNKITKINSITMNEGEGAKVKRLFPTERYDGHHDPFVLMDEFFVSPPNSFPDHEHRGFEAITYMIEGSFQHRDNQGNSAVIGPGGVQAFNAGKSIIHSEAPGDENISHGIQLWLNLPADQKQSDPEYQEIKAENVYQRSNDGLQIKTIAGENSPLELHTDLNYEILYFSKNRDYQFELSEDQTGIIYVISGRINTNNNDSIVNPGEGLLLKEGSELNFIASSDTRLVVLKGKPHGQKIRIRGSFVE